MALVWGRNLFEFERQFSPEAAAGIVASDSRKLSAQERQRDVYESHRHRVFSVGYYMTANELEADEILTGTFIRAFATHREPDAAGVDRALLRELEDRFSLSPEAAAVPEADLLHKAVTRRTDMEEALRLLPPLERLVFLLKDVEGYPCAKIAPLLQLTEAEVQRTVLSARIRIRNAIAAAQRQQLASPTVCAGDASSSMREATALAPPHLRQAP